MPLLDPALLAKLDSLRITARRAEGTMTGLHQSRRKGAAVEFAEHKEYAPGDEVRHIDWKAYAKFDKYYVKQFHEETTLRGYIVVDGSGSMAYQGPGATVTKSYYAAQLAAGMAFLFLRQRDSAALTVVGEAAPEPLPPRSRASHLSEFVRVLEGVQPKGKADLENALQSLAENAPARSFAVLVSDLFDQPASLYEKIRQLRRRRFEVAVLQVIAPAERDLPFDVLTRFESMEETLEITADPRQLRAAYLDELRAFLDSTARECAEAGAIHQLAPTDTAVDAAIIQLLRRREAIFQ